MSLCVCVRGEVSLRVRGEEVSLWVCEGGGEPVCVRGEVSLRV